MKTLYNLTKRNCRLFFKDKGLFFTSLITPAILLVLYITFLAKTFKDSFLSYMGDFPMNESLIDAVVGGQLISSLLAVSCVTVAFCSNLLMVQDKVTGSIKDLRITPVRTSALAVSYFCSTAVATGIVGIVAFGLCLLYLAQMGFYMSLLDVLAVLLDVVLLTLFGTALSSAVNFHLSTNGQASAVGTVVSAGYGFICGAYMPISNYPDGLRKVLSFLPGIYGTCLLRNHALAGVYDSMADEGLPAEFVDGIRESIDCSLTFFGHPVSVGVMYAVLIGAILLLTGVYVLMSSARRQR